MLFTGEGVPSRGQMLTLQKVRMKSKCGSWNEMIIVNYPIFPTLGTLHLPNIALKQDPHSHFQVHMFLRPKETHFTLPISATQGSQSRKHDISSPKGYPFALAHFSNSRSLVKAACNFITWTPVCSSPF